MSRKTLLTEAEVRQFLKLANIGPVGDVKLSEMYGIEEELPPEEEEEMPMEYCMHLNCSPKKPHS